MATIVREVLINARPEEVWDALRDVGALQSRVAPGVVAATELVARADPPVRLVTFASGQVLRERIVSVEDARRRLVWSIEDPEVAHHIGALEVTTLGARQCRVRWTADVLPDSLGEAFAPLMEAGLAAMAAHLSDPAGAG